MLDIRFIRENTDLVKQGIQQKKTNINVDELLKLDEKKRELQFDFDSKRAHQNKISKEIAQLNKEKKDCSAIIAEMQKLSSSLKDISVEISKVSRQVEDILQWLPNLPHNSVPFGQTEADNLLVREWGNINSEGTLLEHQDLAQNLNLLDTKRGAKLSGSGFPVYCGIGALLERALINFMLDFHRENHGYEELAVPFLVNRKSMFGTGQLPKLEEDMYRITEDDLFLIPTGEVPVTNIFADEILSEDILPAKFVTYTPCFRREAGSYGKETKGLQRLHQFNKVEMVRFVKPEESYNALEEMVDNAEKILQALELPYRVLSLNTSDLSFASAKTYDLEVWAPGLKKYLEVSSVSNFEDFQARRAMIRFRDNDGKVKFVHTLNGSGLATPRTFIAILEHYQDSDNTITIPTVLRKYLNGMEKITV